MTEPPLPALDTLFAADTGAALGEPPAYATVSQTALAAHEHLWALDAYLFAGAHASIATRRYAQSQGVGGLIVYVYKITATVEGVLYLTRVL